MSGSCLGLWGGVGRNSGSPPWTILMNVTALEGASCGTIEYPSLGCGGFLTQCSRRGGEVRFEEQYTHGFDRCAPQGVVRARCQGAVLDWTWEGQEVVHTTLRRR